MRFEPVFREARRRKLPVRAYLSTCFGCPFEGKVSEKKVLSLTERLLASGAREVSIGDTIGVANPRQVRSLVKKLIKNFGAKKIALHFHDTRGTALANILASLDLGVRTFDSSLGGLGGCPFAPGAMGNVATEDVVFMLEGMGILTGINLPELVATVRWLSGQMGRDLPGHVSRAGLPGGPGIAC